MSTYISDSDVSSNIKAYKEWQSTLTTNNIDNHTTIFDVNDLDCVLQSCTVYYKDESCAVHYDQDNVQVEEKQNITEADSNHLNTRSTEEWAKIRPVTIRCPGYFKANAYGGITVIVNSRLDNGLYMDSFILDNNGQYVSYNNCNCILGTHSGDIHRRGWLIHSISLNTPETSVNFYLAIAGWKNKKSLPISTLKGLPRVVEYQIIEEEDGKIDNHKIIVDQNFTDSKNTGKSTMIVARINYNIDNKEWTINAVEEMVDGFADDIPAVLNSIKKSDIQQKDISLYVQPPSDILPHLHSSHIPPPLYEEVLVSKQYVEE